MPSEQTNGALRWGRGGGGRTDPRFPAQIKHFHPFFSPRPASGSGKICFKSLDASEVCPTCTLVGVGSWDRVWDRVWVLDQESRLRQSFEITADEKLFTIQITGRKCLTVTSSFKTTILDHKILRTHQGRAPMIPL